MNGKSKKIVWVVNVLNGTGWIVQPKNNMRWPLNCHPLHWKTIKNVFRQSRLLAKPMLVNVSIPKKCYDDLQIIISILKSKQSCPSVYSSLFVTKSYRVGVTFPRSRMFHHNFRFPTAFFIMGFSLRHNVSRQSGKSDSRRQNRHISRVRR